MTPEASRSVTKQRPLWVAVAVPTEHGGWGLTVEPALLGLLVAPGWAGVALAAAGLVAFLARTPLKVALVDRWRHRRLPRTALAEKIAVLELGLLVALVAIAAVVATSPFWIPVVLALPFVTVELWFDMRSRSRRLLPELAGAIGIGGVAAAIVLADGRSGTLAAALWCIVAARVIASIPFVRLQLARRRQQACRRLTSDTAHVAAVVVAAGAVALDTRVLAGFAAIVVLAILEVTAARLRPPKVAVVGAQQVVVGLSVMLVTALGVLAP